MSAIAAMFRSPDFEPGVPITLNRMLPARGGGPGFHPALFSPWHISPSFEVEIISAPASAPYHRNSRLGSA
jgi:hypothetical protein